MKKNPAYFWIFTVAIACSVPQLHFWGVLRPFCKFPEIDVCYFLFVNDLTLANGYNLAHILIVFWLPLIALIPCYRNPSNKSQIELFPMPKTKFQGVFLIDSKNYSRPQKNCKWNNFKGIFPMSNIKLQRNIPHSLTEYFRNIFFCLPEEHSLCQKQNSMGLFSIESKNYSREYSIWALYGKLFAKWRIRRWNFILLRWKNLDKILWPVASAMIWRAELCVGRTWSNREIKL